MSFNNAAVVSTIGYAFDSGPSSSQSRHPRRRVSSDPCLPERLPTSGKYMCAILDAHFNSLQVSYSGKQRG